jgi:hypothetical protein
MPCTDELQTSAPGVELPGRSCLFDSPAGRSVSPHEWPQVTVHTLGINPVVPAPSTGTVPSVAYGQLGGVWNCGKPLSTACGQSRRPQGRRSVVHRLPTAAGQLSPASPQSCPLFGNTDPSLPDESERRHTKLPDWPGENRGIPGDRAGDKWHAPVYAVCRTSGRPQKRLVIHGRHPQARWTKNAA